jgi:hypothetical protein
MVELDLHSCKLSVYMDLIDKINQPLCLRRLEAIGSAKKGIGPSAGTTVAEIRDESPVLPVITEQFYRMLRGHRTVPAGE